MKAFYELKHAKNPKIILTKMAERYAVKAQKTSK
jgi:hypothetical protein